MKHKIELNQEDFLSEYRSAMIPIGLAYNIAEKAAEAAIEKYKAQEEEVFPQYLTREQVRKSLDITHGMYVLLIEQGDLENLNPGGGKDKITKASYLFTKKKLSRIRHDKKRNRLNINDLRE